MGAIARALILLGVVLVAVGLLLALAGKVPWLGRLPGDVYYKRENFTLYFPLTTCLLISAVLSLIFYLFRR